MGWNYSPEPSCRARSSACLLAQGLCPSAPPRSLPSQMRPSGEAAHAWAAWMRPLHTGGWSEAARPRGGLRPGPGHAAAVGRRRQGKGLVCSWWQRVPAGERCWWGSALGQPVCSARTEVSQCHLCGSAATRGQSRGTAGPARAFACCTSPTAVGKPLPAAACSPPQPVAPRFLSPPVLSPDSCFRCLTLRHMESSSFCGFADLLPDPLRD